ncbi:hypothetical protein [Lentzea sp. NBRC 102530]|uniref:hypothetical protein n=1 Tax=Lentzea sp. NBRC 102530 TaxID=3032201 RepID=UPI002556BDD5|nr:hypothetical protein [Lentzea sp. NBRC 102530]
MIGVGELASGARTAGAPLPSAGTDHTSFRPSSRWIEYADGPVVDPRRLVDDAAGLGEFGDLASGEAERNRSVSDGRSAAVG